MFTQPDEEPMTEPRKPKIQEPEEEIIKTHVQAIKVYQNNVPAKKVQPVIPPI